jgi:hypothetical protein
MQRYPFQVFWSDEDNAYIAIAPDLEEPLPFVVGDLSPKSG